MIRRALLPSLAALALAALALFSYAAAFSFAYIKLDAGTGALLLFGAGYWLMYAFADRQTLHDKISNTRILLLSKDPKH